MENIIVELSGKKYLLIELPVLSSTDREIEERIKKYDGIYQGIKKLHTGGFFSRSYAIIKVLIPEENVIEFNKSCYSY